MFRTTSIQYNFTTDLKCFPSIMPSRASLCQPTAGSHVLLSGPLRLLLCVSAVNYFSAHICSLNLRTTGIPLPFPRFSRSPILAFPLDPFRRYVILRICYIDGEFL